MWGASHSHRLLALNGSGVRGQTSQIDLQDNLHLILDRCVVSVIFGPVGQTSTTKLFSPFSLIYSIVGREGDPDPQRDTAETLLKHRKSEAWKRGSS